jgi:nucleotide-binding universal stress UspA family protein
MNMNIKIEIKKILCPVDFSGTSRHATHYAVALAEKFDSELLLLHVEEPSELAMANYYGVSSSGFGLVSIISPEVLAGPRSVASEKVTADELDKVASELQTSRTCRISLRRRFGKGFLEIIFAAKEENVDLIVMGTHGRTGLSHVLMGSTAEKVVRMAPCPVLTVKHPEHEFVMP